ncbi:MAG: hypothetical protein AAF353_00325 [Pseudomonadota bacterium]
MDQMLREFRDLAETHCDAGELKAKVVADQVRRRDVHAALRIGRYKGWDFQPKKDAAEDYTRSHLDLTKFDIISRYPRPRTLKSEESG